MKRFISMLLIGASFILAGCGNGNGDGGKENQPLDITGTWELTGIEVTKSAQLGDETIEVVITFNADKTFTLSQIIGDGRAKDFSGTWALTETTLTGKYENGKAWGSSYQVSIENAVLTMIPESGAEKYTYRKKN
jgi:hypothetical protein